MKVKVGNRVYDCEDQPIMVILTTIDRANISRMTIEATRYAMFSGDCKMTKEEREQWMDAIE